MKTLSLRQKLAKFVDIPGESMEDMPRVILSGGVRVQVEGHHGLSEYAEDRVVVDGRGCRIIIKGDKLVPEAMNDSELVVTGRLWAVELE